ncbi:unnamed protein product, partial [Penicillium nalgiovense]
FSSAKSQNRRRLGKELQISASGRHPFSFLAPEKPEDRGIYQMARKRRALTEEQEPQGRESQRRKFVACVFQIPHAELTTDGINSCQRCHSHKIKCSGDQPCSKCRTVGLADECAYATRDRQVKVSEKYASHRLLLD